jgi:hypothetical protein
MIQEMRKVYWWRIWELRLQMVENTLLMSCSRWIGSFLAEGVCQRETTPVLGGFRVFHVQLGTCQDPQISVYLGCHFPHSLDQHTSPSILFSPLTEPHEGALRGGIRIVRRFSLSD